MSELVEKLFEIHDALTDVGLPHAFGGAIALAYCVEEPRGTRDLDVNIFVDAAEAKSALASLPKGVRVRRKDVVKVQRDGQARLDLYLLRRHRYRPRLAQGDADADP